MERRPAAVWDGAEAAVARPGCFASMSFAEPPGPGVLLDNQITAILNADVRRCRASHATIAACFAFLSEPMPDLRAR